MKFFILLLLLTSGLVSYADASDNDGNKLLESCRPAMGYLDSGQLPTQTEGTEDLQQGFCIGYIGGMKDAFLLAGWASEEQKSPGLNVCIPEKGIGNGQAVRIVVKYLKDNPAKLDQPALVLVLQAFREAYPCKH